MDKVLFSSKSDDWYTPIDLFNSLNEEFNFTLDPCASDLNHKCNKYYTINDNGLLFSWEDEVVFCNPPYSDIKRWCEKCCYEYLSNNITIVLLIPARTDTQYFHEYILPYCELRFIKGRLKFGGSKNSAPFPSILCIYKKK